MDVDGWLPNDLAARGVIFFTAPFTCLNLKLIDT